MFKYYKHLFRFALYMDDFEAEAWCRISERESARCIELYTGTVVTALVDIELPVDEYIEGRAVKVTIPQGTTLSIEKNPKDGEQYMAILLIEGPGNTTHTVNVRGDELEYIVNPPVQRRIKDRIFGTIFGKKAA